jgi:hypothetical protein
VPAAWRSSAPAKSAFNLPAVGRPWVEHNARSSATFSRDKSTGSIRAELQKQKQLKVEGSKIST